MEIEGSMRSSCRETRPTFECVAAELDRPVGWHKQQYGIFCNQLVHSRLWIAMLWTCGTCRGALSTLEMNTSCKPIIFCDVVLMNVSTPSQL